MSTDPASPAPEPSLGREERRPGDLLAHLDQSRIFRPALALVTALVAGLVIAPELATQAYPTDERLLGTPADANYKAPRDIEVLDEAGTAKLVETAESEVPRAFDFDASLAEQHTGMVEAVFAAARTRVEGLLGTHPELATENSSRVHRDRLREAVAPIVPDLEKALGTTLRPEELDALLDGRFDPALARLLVKTVRETLSEPIVPERGTLESDRGKGITVQRVPGGGRTSRRLTDLDSVADVETARREIGPRLARGAPDAPARWREAVASIAARVVEPTLTFNRANTETARELARLSVKPVVISVKKGEMIVRDGDRLNERHLLVFRALQSSSRSVSVFLAAAGAALAVLLLIATGFATTPGQARRLLLSSRDALFLAALFVVGVGTARLWTIVATALHDRYEQWPLEVWLFLLPVAAGAMIVRLVLRTNVAVWFAIVSSLVLGLVVDAERPLVLFALVGSIVGATHIRGISARGDLLRVGVAAGLAQAAAALVMQLFSGQTSVVSYLMLVPAGFLGGLLAGLVTLALTPVVESVFGYTTDLKLLELANLNHPALKELIVQAPGSYHHSVIVGALVESAAEVIGANPLLARVMAYYHDLGKGCNPQYFIENQRSGQNAHDKLKPSMSAMIIKRHVSDGLEIARRYRLGEPITAAIAEHHGTTVIHYFYHKAKEAAEDPDSVSENDYRYPGRKPQSREAALVMLGDSVEAAARSLADPTPARLAGVVNRIVNLKFADEQLEECDITLKDLHLIAKSFSTVLSSIYHTRPEYPELLKDINGKRHGDPDPKQLKRPKDPDDPPEDDRPDNLRRLGLS